MENVTSAIWCATHLPMSLWYHSFPCTFNNCQCLTTSLPVFVLSITSIKLFVYNLVFCFYLIFHFSLFLFSSPIADDLQMGCTELRSKRYISDGFCTSIKPITEVVCAGECLPLDNGQLPFYARYLKVWSREKTKEYRCVNDVVRQKRVHLICDNNERRTYRIRTVRSCKCKRYNREHNKSQLWDNVSSTTNNNNNDNRGARSKSSLERESSRDQRRRARQSQKSGRTRP